MIRAFDHRRKAHGILRSVPSSRRLVGGHALVWSVRAADVIEIPAPVWARLIAHVTRRMKTK